MKRRFVDIAARRRRPVMLVCFVMAAVVLVGCRSTWEFRSTNKEIKLVRIDSCSNWVKLDYQMDPGDTVKFINHAGEDVILEFPVGTVTAQDEDTATTTIIEVKVKKGRAKEITITATPPLTLDELGNKVIKIFIKDPCHGGAKIIIQPASS